MSSAAHLLFTLYAIELAMQIFTMAYVIVLMLNRTRVNPYLMGKRLRIAALLPLLWFTYIYGDAYEVYQVCVANNWQVSEASLYIKSLREALSLTGALITFCLLSGYDFNRTP